MSPEAMKASVREWVAMLNSDDWSERVGAYFTDDVALEEFRAEHADFRRSFAGYQYEIDEMVAEGHTVAVRGTVSARFVEPFEAGGLGEATASGQPAKWSEVMFIQFDGERMGDGWLLVDEVSRMRQLGVLPF